jgi:hypothetical protein
MVDRSRLRLLSRPMRVESAVVQIGAKKTLRVAYLRDGGEAHWLHLEASRSALDSRLSGERCEIFHASTL